MLEAWGRGDAANATVYLGQVAGLTDAIELAGTIVRRVVDEAERLLRERTVAVLGTAWAAT